jgi:hypothetical protein
MTSDVAVLFDALQIPAGIGLEFRFLSLYSVLF